jgi:hypothetical protein
VQVMVGLTRPGWQVTAAGLWGSGQLYQVEAADVLVQGSYPLRQVTQLHEAGCKMDTGLILKGAHQGCFVLGAAT